MSIAFASQVRMTSGVSSPSPLTMWSACGNIPASRGGATSAMLVMPARFAASMPTTASSMTAHRSGGMPRRSAHVRKTPGRFATDDIVTGDDRVKKITSL